MQLHPEGAAHIRGDDPDLAFGQPEVPRVDILKLIGGLGALMHRQRPAGGIVIGHHRARLERHCGMPPEGETRLDHMVVADEDVAKLYPSAPAFTWIYDITDETVPTPISTWQVPGLDVDGRPQEPMTGCHQPSERVSGTIVPFAWFAQGLRLVDIADPFNPTEVGHFLPKAAPGAARPSSNDVTIDDRGIVYLIDRVNGVDIIETTVF